MRILIALLLAANIGYFAWSQGWLADIGWTPHDPSEPQRLAQQIKPQALIALTPAQAKAAEAAALASAPPPPQCLQTGLLEPKQADAVRDGLGASLPAGSWQLDPMVEPARWIVYMGKYGNADQLGRKRQELLALKLTLEPLHNAALMPGLSLGAYEDKAAAQRALEGVTKKGVRTARVVLEREERRGFMLRLPAADEAQRQQLEALRPMLGDQGLRRCPT